MLMSQATLKKKSCKKSRENARRNKICNCITNPIQYLPEQRIETKWKIAIIKEKPTDIYKTN